MKLPNSLPSNQTLTWTTTVNIKGGTIRGFMTNDNGDKIYVVYKFKDELEKETFTAQSLVGQSYYVKGELTEPTPPFHEYAFNMSDYLKSHRAIGILEISSMDFYEYKNSITALLSKQRFKVLQRIDLYFPKSLVAEAKALLVGDQQDVDQQQQRAYQKLGITHLFAISGLHVALVSMLFQQLLLRLGMRREMVVIVLFVALPSYAIIAGGAPSVWRAVITVLLLMLTQLMQYKISIESAISLCFLIFVIYEPNMIYQVGFQLSFLATLAIILSAKVLANLKTWYGISLWITFACQLLVTPLLLYHFYEISLSSFIMNLIFVPLFSYIILPINLLLLFLCYFFPLFFDWLLVIYEPCRAFLTTIIYWLQSMPYQMWNPGRPMFISLCIILLLVLFIFFLFEVKKYRVIGMIGFIAFLMVMTQLMTMHKDLRITFLSVGQGDSTLIEVPNRKAVYLIDSGGVLRFSGDEWRQSNQLYEIGRQIVVPYLKGRGIKRIDRLILTHADADHVEGAEEVMQEVKVEEIHISPNSMSENAMDDVALEAVKQKIPIKEKLAGEGWRINNIDIRYVMPMDLEYEGNNDSIVAVIDYHGFRVVLPGDLEKEGEAELIKKNPSIVEQTTILKAGHHGSKTSTTQAFLDVVQPKLVIFSNGLNNRYNHPAKEVVERLKEGGIPTFNTGTEGTIQIQITDKVIIKKDKEQYELQK